MAAQVFEIPTKPGQPQRSQVSLAGTVYGLLIYWDDPAALWVLDIADSIGTPIISGLPLVTGHDLLEQYAYLGIGGMLLVQSDFDWTVPPTFQNLGVRGHLYFVPTAAPTLPVRKLPLSPGPETRTGTGITLPQPAPVYCMPAVTIGSATIPYRVTESGDIRDTDDGSRRVYIP